jgi:hypothetical protein
MEEKNQLEGLEGQGHGGKGKGKREGEGEEWGEKVVGEWKVHFEWAGEGKERSKRPVEVRTHFLKFGLTTPLCQRLAEPKGRALNRFHRIPPREVL